MRDIFRGLILKTRFHLNHYRVVYLVNCTIVLVLLAAFNLVYFWPNPSDSGQQSVFQKVKNKVSQVAESIAPSNEAGTSSKIKI